MKANPGVRDVSLETVFALQGAGSLLKAGAGLATRSVGGATLDLFGGANSQIPGAINVDIAAQSGVRASTTALPFADSWIREIIASGPRAAFLPEASRVLQPGGRLFINSTQRNTFGQLPNAETLQGLGFRVIQENEPLAPRFSNLTFRLSDGNAIPRQSVRTTILERNQ